VPGSCDDPRPFWRDTVEVTQNLLDLARRTGARFVHASSYVYGTPRALPVDESHPRAAHSPYAASKIAAEDLCAAHHRETGLPVTMLRVFNAYGPGQHLPPVHAPVIPYFLKQSFNDGTLVVHGDGNQTRDYVYLDDVVQAMTAAASAVNVNQQIINVGSGVETSLRDLVRQITETTGGSPQVIYNPRNEGGVRRMRADLSLAQQLLGYQPVTSLEQGLRLTFEQDQAVRVK
nr:GDP-mannose 4,6-dehydratase [Anaerolinea sp.]